MRPRSHAAAVIAAVICWYAATAGIWTRIPLSGDQAIFVEYAARAVDGQVPHVDFHEWKPTGFVWLAIPVVAAGRLAGIPDWASVRLFSLLAVAALVASFFLAVHDLLRRAGLEALAVRGGWTAAAAIISLRALPDIAAAGIEPKILTLLGAVAAIPLLVRNRPVAAGAVAALAPFQWQPGALAWCVPLLLAARMGPRRTVHGFLAGSAGTVLAVTGLLLATGSLSAFVHQALLGAIRTFEDGSRSGSPWRVARTLWRGAGWELLALSPFTLVAVLFRRFGLWPLAALSAAFLAWSLVDFQGIPDALPMMIPLVALGGAVCGTLLLPRTCAAVTAAFFLASLAPHPMTARATLTDQRIAASRFLDAAGDGAVLAVGHVAVPLLANRPTAGADLFADGIVPRLESSYPGGVESWVEDRLAERPSGVVLGPRVPEKLGGAIVRNLSGKPGWRPLLRLEEADALGNPRYVRVWVGPR